MKCQLCKQARATLAWQPFGPDESPLSFQFLGSHYRTFTVIKICDNCKDQIKATAQGQPFHFTHQSKTYLIDHSGCHHSVTQPAERNPAEVWNENIERIAKRLHESHKSSYQWHDCGHRDCEFMFNLLKNSKAHDPQQNASTERSLI